MSIVRRISDVLSYVYKRGHAKPKAEDTRGYHLLLNVRGLTCDMRVTTHETRLCTVCTLADTPISVLSSLTTLSLTHTIRCGFRACNLRGQTLVLLMPNIHPHKTPRVAPPGRIEHADIVLAVDARRRATHRRKRERDAHYNRDTASGRSVHAHLCDPKHTHTHRIGSEVSLCGTHETWS